MTSRLKIEWDKADSLESRADDQKWKVARMLSEDNDNGKTYRVLADETGRSHTTVGRWARTWRQFGTPRGSRSFNECLEEVRSESKESRQADRHRATARQIARTNPEEAVEIIQDAGDEESVRELFRRASNRTGSEDRRELRRRLDLKKAQREQQKNDSVGFRAMEFVGNNAKIRKLLGEQLKLIQNVELPDDVQELGREAIDQIIETAKLVQLALLGNTDIDWDEELGKLS
jgi:uncharacterized protein YerC